MNSFLKTLIDEKKIQKIEKPENLINSYKEKSEICLKSAEVLVSSKLYETSISMSYYAMYNISTALFYKYKIKCENHTGIILLLKEIGEAELSEKLSYAKRERIDKQYYTDFKATREDAEILLKDAREFTASVKSKLILVSESDITQLHNKLNLTK